MYICIFMYMYVNYICIYVSSKLDVAFSFSYNKILEQDKIFSETFKQRKKFKPI